MSERTEAQQVAAWLKWRNHDSARGHLNNALNIIAHMPALLHPGTVAELEHVAGIERRVRAGVELHEVLREAVRVYLVAVEHKNALDGRRCTRLERRAAWRELEAAKAALQKAVE